MTLRRFGVMPRLPLATPLPVLPLIRAALDLPEAGWAQTDGDKDDLAQVGICCAVRSVYVGLDRWCLGHEVHT